LFAAHKRRRAGGETAAKKSSPRARLRCQILAADSETCDEWTAHLQQHHDAAQKFSDAAMTKVVATPAALCLSSFIVGPPAITPRENKSDQETERYGSGCSENFRIAIVCFQLNWRIGLSLAKLCFEMRVTASCMSV
jgi:hypothetical protein